MVTDPVCGMQIDPKSAAGKVDFEGQSYYFCSVGCKKSFEKDPRKYIAQHHDSAHHH